MFEPTIAGSKITGHTTLTLSDLYTASFWNTSARTWWVYGTILVVASASALWRDGLDGLGEMAVVVLVALLILTVIALVVWLGMVAFIFARLSSKQKQIDYEIDRERFVVRDAAGSTVIRPWTEVKGCREHKTGINLRLRPMGSHLMVKRAFSSADLETLRTILKAALQPAR